MIFSETELRGVFVIGLEPNQDHRGIFARTFCAKEFSSRGLNPSVVQCSLSLTYKKGTVRGMHYQVAPAAEAKLVRCTRGAIYDVVIDLRPQSPTYQLHVGVELTAENRYALYVPEMFAHGYQTLMDETEVLYQMSESYNPVCARGVCFDDPAFGVQWPLPVSGVSEKDRSWPLFEAIVLDENESNSSISYS